MRRVLMKNKKSLPVIIAILVLAGAVAVFGLFYFGVLHLNNPDENKYAVRGVDVSHYQGLIDWDVLAAQNISFAFIKATEGSSTVDARYEENADGAIKAGLRVGAYHFFSFESSGEEQAELFCKTVESVPGMLPPVVDVEFYGRYKTAPDTDLPRVKQELRAMIDALTENYGKKPVIYADEKSYNAIVKGDFDDCNLWYRSVYSSVPKNISWVFWQYSNRHVLQGYNGEERYIDMNVFKGGAAEFAAYPD